MVRISAFRDNEGGGVAILFALSAMTLTGLIGGGLDLGRLQQERQTVGNALMLTCQFMAKSTPENGQKQQNEAQDFFATNAKAGRDQAPSHTLRVDPAKGGGPDQLLTAEGEVPTVFMSMFGFRTMPVKTEVLCPVGVAAAPPAPSEKSGDILLRETFESGEAAANNGWTYVRNYNGWTTTNEGLELSAGYKQGAPEGRSVGELVADRSIGITRRVTLRAGRHELRYWYARAAWRPTPAYDTAYDPAPICAPKADDVAWATADPAQPSRMAVYLSADTPGWSVNWMGMLPTNPAWRPSDLLETCIYARGWVERSIIINVPSSGDYWLTFAGQTSISGEGAQIDDIRLCVDRCAGERRLAPHETPGTVLFRENFLSLPTGCCSIDASALGWTAYPDRHEVWSSDWSGPSRAGRHNVVELDNSSNVRIGRSLLLPTGTYELRYTYAARIKFTGIADVPTCGSGPTDPVIRAFPTGSAIAASGDWQNVPRNYDTNAMAAFINGENGQNRAPPTQMVDYCIYGGTVANPVERSIIFRAERPDFYRFSFFGQGASDSVGALFSNVMICAVRCSASPSRDPLVVAVR
jgi:hypothetical protein